MKQEQFNSENQQIGQLIEFFLKGKTIENASPTDTHLDEDSLAAFVDGALSERESEPLMRHLVGCSPCRRITADLARLAEELTEPQQETVQVPVAEPSRLQQFWQKLGFANLGFSDEAVFAHGESAEEDDETENKENQDSAKESDSESEK